MTKEMADYVKEERKRKQMETAAEDLFNTEKVSNTSQFSHIRMNIYNNILHFFQIYSGETAWGSWFHSGTSNS